MTQDRGFRLRTRMTARDTTEQHRVSSPLELLFDLTFVVAIAQIASALAHGISRGDGAAAVGPFLMVFFAIWWAWMNFTWFASSYDTDDVLYRVLTMVQMAGVLVLAAGVPAAISESSYPAITLGYFVMRAGLAAQWLRAGIEHPAGRATAWRYASGVAIVQVGWLVRLFLPGRFSTAAFVVLVVLELSVPIWAERTGRTSWHPHHIAERYGLFTIIVLGESVLAATEGLEGALGSSGVSAALVAVALAALVLLFALWWLYFLVPAGEGLAAHRNRTYLWGYGHYGIFAALAALGAGLEVAVEASGRHAGISDAAAAASAGAPGVASAVSASTVAVGYAVAIPVGVFLVLLWAVNAPLVPKLAVRPIVILPAAVVVLLLPLASPLLSLPGVVGAIALVCVAVIVLTIAPPWTRQPRPQ
jgi:low temperature requirement protein LtrA